MSKACTYSLVYRGYLVETRAVGLKLEKNKKKSSRGQPGDLRLSGHALDAKNLILRFVEVDEPQLSTTTVDGQCRFPCLNSRVSLTALYFRKRKALGDGGNSSLPLTSYCS